MYFYNFSMLQFELNFLELHFMAYLSESLAVSISFFWAIATDTFLELFHLNLMVLGFFFFFGRGGGILGCINREYIRCTYRTTLFHVDTSSPGLHSVN